MENEIHKSYTFVVIGGGLAGVGAALAAARSGIDTALIQDRPVLGGNSSSEIRVAPAGAGAYNGWARETGIVSEILEKDRACNHAKAVNSRINSTTDLILYDECRRQDHLDLYLNTSVRDVNVGETGLLEGVTAVQLGTERRLLFSADLWADCTGDGTVAHLAGCESMVAENLMGSSLLISAVDTGDPAPFTPPAWAHAYSEESELRMRRHASFETGYYWLELGSPYDTVGDNETIRDELLSHVYGVWDHIKNHCTEPGVREQADTYALDWVGVVPGKRESRRTVGIYVLSVDDIRNRVRHSDDVCHGGWYVDLHTDGGILATSLPPNPIFNDLPDDEKDEFIVTLYPIPFRSLCARDVKNLFIPGRHFSAHREAFGSARVQCTTALMGEVAGTAAWLCSCRGVLPADISENDTLVRQLKEALTRLDVFIPHYRDDDSKNLARKGVASASSEHKYTTPDEPQDTISWDGPLGLVMPVDTDRVEGVEIWIETGPQETGVELVVEELEDIWDNYKKADEEALSRDLRPLPANSRGWVHFPIVADVGSRVLRFVIKSHSPVALGCTRPLLPGFIRQKLERTRWHSRIDEAKDISVPIRLLSNRKLFGPDQAINGWSRPVQSPNLWISDPDKPFPQWLEVSWSEPITVARVIILFDNNLHVEHRLRPGRYRAPECVKDWYLEALIDGAWRTVCETKGNFIRRNERAFAPVVTKALRVVVESTNGDPSARIYEVKVYAD